MRYRRSKQLFYFSQFFTVKLGEKLYQYKPEKEVLPFLRSAIALLVHSTRILLTKQKSGNTLQSTYKHIVYIDTLNQRNAVLALLGRLNKSEVLTILYQGLSNTRLDIPNQVHCHLPLKKLYGLALINIFQTYFLAKPLLRKYAGRVNSSHIYFNLALFRAAITIFDQYLKKLRPLTVTVVNDHNLFPLALICSARKSGVTSVYIQHAAVSGVFPKLLADVALLEGRHSLDTYNVIGNYSRSVRLVGIIRLDGFIGFRKAWKESGLVAGVCLKAYYSPALMEELVREVRRSSQVAKVVLRPHPGSSASFWNLIEKLKLPVSDSRVENAIQFLQGVDVVISSESTILLEASLLRIPTVYFDDKVVPFDLCGYAKNGIITSVIDGFSEIPQAIGSIKESSIDMCFRNCKYYCDSLGTERENKSVESLVDFYENAR